MTLLVVYFLGLATMGRAAAMRSCTQGLAERWLIAATTTLALAVVVATGLAAVGLFWRWSLSFAAFAVGFGGATLGGLAGIPGEIRAALGAALWCERSPAPWISLAVAALTLAWVIIAARMPLFGVDDYTYHAPFAVYVAQTGHLGPFPVVEPFEHLNSFPKSVEMIAATFVAFTKSTDWIELVQPLFIPAAVLALYCVARVLGAASRRAATFSFAPFAVPMIVCQLKTAYVDVALASLTCVLAWGLIAAAEGRTAGYWVAVLSCGMLLGTKFTGIYLGPPILLTAYLLVLRCRPDLRRRALSMAALGILMVVALGGHWLIENAIHYGNPIWPVRVNALSLPGWGDPASAVNWHGPALDWSSTHRWLFAWIERRTWYGIMYTYDSDFAGWGPLWLGLWLPALIAVLVVSTADSRRARTPTPLFCFAAGLTIVYLFDPTRQFQRYNLWMPMLTSALAAVAAERAGRPVASVADALWIGGLFWTVFNCAGLGFITAAEARSLARLETPSPRPLVVGEFFTSLPRYVADDDILVYTWGPPWILQMWNARLANRVIGHRHREGTLTEVLTQERATLVLGVKAELDEALAGSANETLLKDKHSELELRRIMR